MGCSATTIHKRELSHSLVKETRRLGRGEMARPPGRNCRMCAWGRRIPSSKVNDYNLLRGPAGLVRTLLDTRRLPHGGRLP